MPPPCRAALLLRQESAKASTKKLNAAKRATGSDGRMRGTLLYHGASTGRWSGKLLQPQNLPRPAMVKNILPVVELIRHGNAELIRFLYGNVLTPLSDCLRGLIVAAPGHELLSFDYSNIEARLTAWFAGDTDKLARFAEIDANPDMPDMYRVAAAGIYNVHPDDIPKADPRRQVGKVAELALGFGGGVSALLQMAANYHIDMAAALPPLLDTATAERVDQVTERWEQTLKRKNDKGIPRDAWLAAELAKRAWRDANPKIVEAWHLADGAAWEAVGEPGRLVGNEIPLRFLRKNGFLWMQLPSGRPLAYGDPRVRDVEVPWSDKTVAKPARETKRAVTVMSTERPKGGMPGFIRYPLYPGLEIQHAVQATARDLLAAGMLRVDQAGYRLVLSVHDEALAEERTGARDIDEFVTLMCALPGWARGLPVVGDAWRGPRYHKHD
jgi:DNA polymerase